MSSLIMWRLWVGRCCPSCLDCHQEGLHPDDVHDAREIVGEHVQGHLGRNLGQPLHQKVGCSHPHLERAKGMFSRLTAHAHCCCIARVSVWTISASASSSVMAASTISCADLVKHHAIESRQTS